MTPLESEAFRAWLADVDWLAVWNAAGLTLLLGLLFSAALYSDEDQP